VRKIEKVVFVSRGLQKTELQDLQLGVVMYSLTLRQRRCRVQCSKPVGCIAGQYRSRHSRLISPVCDSLPVREELICRCASFIMKCLNSCNGVVHSVSRNGIYGMRMLSPIGANVQFCSNFYGMSPNDISYVSRRLAWTAFWNSVIAPDLDKINLIKELLSVKFHKRADFTILRVRS